MEIILKQVLPSLLVAVVTALVTVRLSFRRFRSERMWERKVQAYEKIFESLHHLKAYCDGHIKAFENGTSLDGNMEQELYGRFRLAIAEINKYRDIGSFLIDESAVERLKHFEDDLEKTYEGKTIYEIADNQYGAVTKCILDINKIARSDLEKY